MDKKKILILSITDQDSDPRVIRQVDFLNSKYEIYCCGINNSFIKKENFFRIRRADNFFLQNSLIGILILFKFYNLAEKFILKNKYKIDLPPGNVNFDLIIANDMNAIATAYIIFKGRKVFADFHEYAPEEFEDKLCWKLINKKLIIYQSKKYFPRLNASSTVCQSISNEYKKKFSITPAVITNAAPLYDLKPSPVDEKIRIIHHGAAISSRRIELMIDTAKLLDSRFSLDLMLIPNEHYYYTKLKRISEKTGNVRVIPPVNYKDIIYFCNQYDIGLFILPPINLNYKFALPNKFFEFVQSRLAIVTGPSPEMSAYINTYNLGFAANTFDPEEIAERINRLSNNEIQNYKYNSHSAAKELSSEINKKIMLGLVNKILADTP